MKFNFKKITSVLASAVMLGATLGIAAAATYPAPFVQGGSANVAVVVTSGTHAGSTSDYLAAVDLGQDLQAELAKQTASTGTGTASVSGEAYALFTSGTKLYLNDSLNNVKDLITDSNMPTVLADSDFSGNVDADVTYTVTLGSDPRIIHAKQPDTSENDPVVGVKFSTTQAKYLYNMTATFNKAVNLTNADSEGEAITLFGQTYTISSATDNTDLVLYESAETISLSVGGASPVPSTTVTLDGEDFTVELTAATDSSATIKVTDSSGNSASKEINEAASKKVQGVEVGVNLADESTATDTISADIIVGTQKMILKDGNTVKVGADEDNIDGTLVDFVTTTYPGNITKIVIQVRAPDSDEDAIIPGGAFVDPVFGSFKLDFSGLNVEADSDARETITIKCGSSDQCSVTLTDHQGYEAGIDWYNNKTAVALQDDSEYSIRVIEKAIVNESHYVVVGNEDEGHLVELDNIYNDTGTDATDDEVKFKDVFSGETYSTQITTEGTGSVEIGGKTYTVTYVDDTATDDDEYVRLGYPDSSGNNAIIFPTIETSKGAKVAFIEPITIDLEAWDGTNTLSGSDLLFPDGDGYETIDVTFDDTWSGDAQWNFTDSASDLTLNTSKGANVDSVKITIGKISYNLTTTATDNETKVYLLEADGAGNIARPALVIWEEEDDNNEYHALQVVMEGAGVSTDDCGVSDIERTWGLDLSSGSEWSEFQLESDDDIYEEMDLWGSIITIDKSETDSYEATISYPGDQVYAQVYIAEVAASITAATAGTGSVTELGSVTVKDSEVSSVQSKNLIVVGGSCINSVAAKILGGGYCGADFTSATDIGSGQFLVKVVDSPYTTGKVAMLVAGYEAADTAKAVKYVTTETPATDVGTELKKVTTTYADVA